MWHTERTRRFRRSGILIFLLGGIAGAALCVTAACQFEVASNVLAVCAVSCFVLCVPFLVGCGGGTPQVDVDFPASDLIETTQALGACACEDVMDIADVGGTLGPGDMGGDLGGAGSDCGFDGSGIDFGSGFSFPFF